MDGVYMYVCMLGWLGCLGLSCAYLEDAVLVHEEVAWAQVAVQQARAVHVLKTGEHVQRKQAHRDLGQMTVLRPTDRKKVENVRLTGEQHINE